MTDKTAEKLKPTTLRLLLSISMFIVTGLAVVGFAFAQKQLAAYATEVSHKRVDANASGTSLQTLQAIQKELTDDEELIQKAKNIKHTSSLPQFKAIDDLLNHAQANKITLTELSFADTASGAAAPTSPATTTPAAPAAAATSEGVDISFGINEGEVSTANFVQFLHDIEHSMPKMQVKGIALQKGSSVDTISIDKITVTMFTN